MIIATVVRSIGIEYHGALDHIWETYWFLVAGMVGLILTAITAFRSFFVARQNRRDEEHADTTPSWYRRSKEKLRWYRFRSKSSGEDTAWTSGSDETKVEPEARAPVKVPNRLPTIPKPTMTGIRTFINGRKTPKSGANVMASYVDDDDVSPPPPWKAVEEGPPRDGGGIMVRHDLELETESRRSTRCYQCGRRREEHPVPVML